MNRCLQLQPLTHAAQDSPVNLPETRYAMTSDGVHVGYQIVGDGSTVL